MVVYDYDSNAILTMLLKSKLAANHLQAITNIYLFLNSKGIFPKMHIKDKEFSNIVKNYIKTLKHIELLLVPPYSYQANMVEKAIHIFKNHFVTSLATMHPSFPLYLWCHLLPLAITTLNLLCPSHVNSNLLAHKLLYSVFNYNKTLLALSRTKVLVYKAIEKRGT